jgi:hypothetical protein
MEKILSQFEIELRTVQCLNELAKQNSKILDSTSNKPLEEQVRTLIAQSDDILAMWLSYEDILNSLNIKLDRTEVNIMNDLKCAEEIIMYSTSDLFQQTLTDMIENRALFERLEICSKNLCDRFAQNKSTQEQFDANKLKFQEKFKTLSNLTETLKARLEESSFRHQNYLRLVESTNELILSANKLLGKSDSTSGLSEDIDMLESQEKVLHGSSPLRVGGSF